MSVEVRFEDGQLPLLPVLPLIDHVGTADQQFAHSSLLEVVQNGVAVAATAVIEVCVLPSLQKHQITSAN